MCACGGGTGKENTVGTSVESSGNGTGGDGVSGSDGSGVSAPGADGSDTDASGTSIAATEAPGVGIRVNANAALAKENVYRVREIAIPGLAEGGNASVEAVAGSGGKVYAVIKIYDRESGNKYCAAFAEEGADTMQTAVLELPESGNKAEQASGMWSQENARYSEFAVGKDGNIYALRQEGQHEYVCCWYADGRLAWQAEPCGNSKEDLSVWSVFPAADGSLEVLLTGENAYRLTVGEDGSLPDAEMARLSEDAASALDNCRGLIRKDDGSCLLLDWNAGGSWSLRDYDLKTDTLGEAFKLSDELSAIFPSNGAFTAAMDGGLLWADRKGVFSYNMADKQSSLKMNYVNSDRNITGALSLLELDETRFFMLYNEDYTYELKAGIFEYVKPEDIPDKTVVVLGGLSVNADIKKRVIQYNRENSRNRVVLKEYGSYENLNLDIVSGKMPDILIPDGVPMDSYIEKGLIADVGKLIGEDKELSGTEFMKNVFDAYSVDGRLMYVTPSFTLFTMAAKTSLVGDGKGWSMGKMKEVLGGMDPGARLLDGLDRKGFMEKAMMYCGNDFIDVDTGKCAFDSQDFIDIIKFANGLPEEKSWVAKDGQEAYEMQYLKGRTLLMELHVWTFAQNVDERLFYQLNGYLGGDYTFTGFPASAEKAAEGGKAVLCAENLMALSARSENMDGTWDFARYYLTDEYQKSLKSSLPVNRKIFVEWAEEETRRSCRTNEKGEKEEYDLTLCQNGKAVAVPPLDQEQLQGLIAYVESVTEIPFENTDVMNIINEEMGSYFSGQKAAEDVAGIIQNRVQMYVLENR